MCARCVFLVLLNVYITLMCVHYLGDFDENISDFSGTKPNSLKILPHKQKFRKGKKKTTLQCEYMLCRVTK